MSLALGACAAVWAVVESRRAHVLVAENHDLQRKLSDDRSTVRIAEGRDEVPSAPGPPADSGNDATLSFLRSVGRVVVPAGFVVSLAYYFGWARTRQLYRELGVDHSLLGFSTDDYALRSLGVLVTPLPVVAGYVLVLALLFAGARWWYSRRDRTSRARSSGLVLALVVAVSMWTFVDGWNDGDWTDTIAFLVISTAVAVLSADLVVRQEAGEVAGASDRVSTRSSTASVNFVALALLALFAFSAFEIARHHARDEGIEAAKAAETHPDRFACVVLVSARPLVVLDAAGEPIVAGGGDEFYRYGNLRVFTRSSGRLFVWPSDRSPRAGLVIVNEADVVSAQLVPQREFGACPEPA